MIHSYDIVWRKYVFVRLRYKKNVTFACHYVRIITHYVTKMIHYRNITASFYTGGVKAWRGGGVWGGREMGWFGMLVIGERDWGVKVGATNHFHFAPAPFDGIW